MLHRGNNRQSIFLDDEDRTRFVDLLQVCAQQARVDVHAFVLMPGDFQLLLTPADASGVSGFMQSLGRSYVRYFNQRYQRSGTLWEGRYRSTVVQADRHLLQCMVHLDALPVGAGLAQAPAQYAWSSCRHYLGMAQIPWLRPHALWWGVGNTPFAREAEYAHLLSDGIGQALATAFAQAVESGWVLGSEDFVAGLQKAASRRVVKKSAGRPRKTPPGD
ncbi:MAG: transposase [Comamonas sp.]